MESYRSLEHGSWGRPAIIVIIKTFCTEALGTSRASPGLPVPTRETVTTLAHLLPVLSLGAITTSETENSSCSVPFPLSSGAYWKAVGKRQKYLWSGTKLFCTPTPRDAQERPCLSAGFVDCKHAQHQGPAPGSSRKVAPARRLPAPWFP